MVDKDTKKLLDQLKTEEYRWRKYSWICILAGTVVAIAFLGLATQLYALGKEGETRQTVLFVALISPIVWLFFLGGLSFIFIGMKNLGGNNLRKLIIRLGEVVSRIEATDNKSCGKNSNENSSGGKT